MDALTLPVLPRLKLLHNSKVCTQAIVDLPSMVFYVSFIESKEFKEYNIIIFFSFSVYLETLFGKTTNMNFPMPLIVKL